MTQWTNQNSKQMHVAHGVPCSHGTHGAKHGEMHASKPQGGVSFSNQSRSANTNYFRPNWNLLYLA